MTDIKGTASNGVGRNVRKSQRTFGRGNCNQNIFYLKTLFSIKEREKR